jgi:hypothetical protein
MGSGAFLVETCRQLGNALVEAWRAYGDMPTIPSDEDEVIFAMRLVAQRCLYGVDRNPVAVDLAKMSLWLVTLAKDHSLTFVDHALRHGDSLVGLSVRQIEALSWDPSNPILKGLGVREPLEKLTALRKCIREADETVSDLELRDLWAQAQSELSNIRLFGDLVVAAYFAAEKSKDREGKRSEYVSAVVSGKAESYRGWLEEMRHAEKPLAPLHWEIEFPEVFETHLGAFDAIVGNPPFLGGTRISEVAGMTYFQWIVGSYPPCEHHCDLVAYFFRRGFELIHDGACLGFIATNTIAQGDTREGGLLTILKSGGQIYSARRRYKWPGQAAVVVSIIHISKGSLSQPVFLDEKIVPRVSAYLFSGVSDDSPLRLQGNPYFSLGSKIYSQGFLFAEGDPECTPLAEYTRILDRHPSWSSRIRPYLIGDEINSLPTQSPQRYVIYLSDIATEDQLVEWPELKAIVEEKVKPGRLSLGNNPNNTPLKKRWWAYQAHRPELYALLAHKERALCISRVGQHLGFVFAPTDIIFSEAVVVFDIDRFSGFCSLQSRPHEIWARFFASSMKDDLRYTPSDCFETFPFPEGWVSDLRLESVGRDCYEFRAALMIRNDDGLTKTYNRFHDPQGRDPEIVKLRELHAAMDRAVLDAYGWTDIKTGCEFLLDYEIDEQEWGDKKKPWRYRWPDDVRDEVLARLLELNSQRAKDEARSGAASIKNQGRKAKAKRAVAVSHTKDLFL